MELAKARRRANAIRIVGLTAVALWLASVATFGLTRSVYAQDDSSVSNDNSDATNTDEEAPDAAATPPDIGGSWSGPAIDKKLGDGTLTLTLTQASKAVGATWDVAFPDDTEAGGTGAGKLNGSKALKLVLSDPDIPKGKCTMTISSKVIDSAEEIKGTYTLKKCFAKNSSGTIDLTPAATPTPTP